MIVQRERENFYIIIAEPLTFASDDLPRCLTWLAQTIFHLSLNVVVLAYIADHQLAQEFVLYDASSGSLFCLLICSLNSLVAPTPLSLTQIL